jgi:hypothetical protein
VQSAVTGPGSQTQYLSARGAMPATPCFSPDGNAKLTGPLAVRTVNWHVWPAGARQTNSTSFSCAKTGAANVVDAQNSADTSNILFMIELLLHERAELPNSTPEFQLACSATMTPIRLIIRTNDGCRAGSTRHARSCMLSERVGLLFSFQSRASRVGVDAAGRVAAARRPPRPSLLRRERPMLSRRRRSLEPDGTPVR